MKLQSLIALPFIAAADDNVHFELTATNFVGHSGNSATHISFPTGVRGDTPTKTATATMSFAFDIPASSIRSQPKFPFIIEADYHNTSSAWYYGEPGPSKWSSKKATRDG